MPDPSTLPHTIDVHNPVAMARYKLLGPQLFYEFCDDIEPCPRIGWDTTSDGPPQVIADILNSMYKHLRAQNYDHNTLDLDFWSSTKFCPSLQDLLLGWNGIQFISMIQRSGPPLCLPVKLLYSPSCVADIHLKLGGEWMKFVDFLDLLVLAAPVDPAKIMHIWKHSGKTFDLLALPRELRDQIWAYAIFSSERALVGSGRRGRQLPGVRSPKGSVHSIALLSPKMPRQIREEGNMILWTQGTFQYKHARDFSEFFIHTRPEDIAMLRKMELNFGYESWLRLLGAQLTTRVRFTACSSLDIFKTAQLQEVKLIFREPADLERSQFRLWHYTSGCHTQVVQWIFDLLVPILARASIKRLKIEGFVKHAQKACFIKEIAKLREILNPKFDFTLEDLKEERDGDGGVSLAGAREQALLAMPNFQVEADIVSDQYDPEELYTNVQLPPTCLCKHKCTTDPDDFLQHIDDDDMDVLGYQAINPE
ncbi:hypothetical protein FKW77_002685 [Venturia effusa]|uniref:Uncharacterized protein n=1 Tax=Venturia effusa TaxID=50376 RepID=A0A517KZ89_9PEZI|nr:hypothetical protein FKW77_002685 [Venturia effusa]